MLFPPFLRYGGISRTATVIFVRYYFNNCRFSSQFVNFDIRKTMPRIKKATKISENSVAEKSAPIAENEPSVLSATKAKIDVGTERTSGRSRKVAKTVDAVEPEEIVSLAEVKKRERKKKPTSEVVKEVADDAPAKDSKKKKAKIVAPVTEGRGKKKIIAKEVEIGAEEGNGTEALIEDASLMNKTKSRKKQNSTKSLTEVKGNNNQLEVAPTARKAASKAKSKRLEKVEFDVESSEDDDEDEYKPSQKKKKPEKKAAGKNVKSTHSGKGKKVVEAEEIIQKEEPVKRGRKRPAAETTAPAPTAVSTVDTDKDTKPSKPKKAALINVTETVYKKADFENDKEFNLKIASWNVAGLRSWLKKDGLEFLQYEEPDIFCLQEIKCTIDQLPEEAQQIPGYHPYWLCMPGGYAGVAVYSKIMPINVEYGIGDAEFDDAGRIITAEYEKFFLINVYVPNSGRKLVNLTARMRWEKLFQQHVQKYDALKPVIICGDMNVSHQEIDLANPKSNTRSAGFTKEERDKMTELLALGYVDTFRHFYPDRVGAYTYWTYMANARSRNVGWRLDYFIVSKRFTGRVRDNVMRSQCKGSDHCPITLFLSL